MGVGDLIEEGEPSKKKCLGGSRSKLQLNGSLILKVVFNFSGFISHCPVYNSIIFSLQ